MFATDFWSIFSFWLSNAIAEVAKGIICCMCTGDQHSHHFSQAPVTLMCWWTTSAILHLCFFSNMFFCHLQTFPTRTVVVQFSHGNSSQKCPALRSVIYNLPRTKIIQDLYINIHSFQKFKNWSANLSNDQHGVFRLCICLHIYAGDYITQLHRDYDKPLQRSLWTNQCNGMS